MAAKPEKQKPSVKLTILACEWLPWAKGHRAFDLPSPLSPDPSVAEFMEKRLTAAVELSDAAIARMLSGSRPKSIGANTALVSDALILLATMPACNEVMVFRKGMCVPVKVKPYVSGLAEVRKSAGRVI